MINWALCAASALWKRGIFELSMLTDNLKCTEVRLEMIVSLSEGGKKMQRPTVSVGSSAQKRQAALRDAEQTLHGCAEAGLGIVQILEVTAAQKGKGAAIQ